MYRHPIATASVVDNFKDSLNKILISLNNSKKQYYCFGDFNIDLMQISTNDSIRRYAHMLLSCTCLSLIDLPTRISLTSKTLLDHISAPTTSHLNVVVQSPFCTGEGRNGFSIPRGSHPAVLPWTTLFLIFYPCCPMRGHIWTAFLNPIDRPPTSSSFFRTTLLSPSFHPKSLHYSSHPPLILIFMLLISGDIHPNPGPKHPCSVCSRRVTWGNRSVQRTNCSLWVHLSCSGLSPADFRKISPGHSWTCPMCPSSSQSLPSLSHPNPVSLSFSVSPSTHTPNPPPSLTNTHKTISSKINRPKTTTNNPTYPPNHPQLIFTYPPSASSIPSPQTQRTISPLTQSSFHPSSPSQNNLRILKWNANGIRPRRTELIQFLSHNEYDLIFIRESHLSFDSTFRIPGYKTLQKNRSMTRRETTNSTGNLGGGILILVKNGLTYTSLSTQSLSSLDPAPII